MKLQWREVPWDRSQDDNEHVPTVDDRYPEQERYGVEKVLVKETRPAGGRPRVGVQG